MDLGEEIGIRIIVGVDALGRSTEAQKLDSYLGKMAQLEQLAMVEMTEVASRYASFEGINPVGLIKPPAQVQQEQQAQQQAANEQQMMQSGAESVGNAAGEMVKQGTQ